MKKRMFAYLMTLCMTVTMFSGTALAEEKESTTECVCTTLCTEDSVNDLCDVCKKDIADCIGGGENTEEPIEPTEKQTEENKQEEENFETQEENIEDETESVEETYEGNVPVDNQENIPEDEEQVISDNMLPKEVGGVITLDEDVTLSEKWTVSDEVTLDLNGNTLDVSAKGISVKGKLTVKDSSVNADGTIKGVNNMISVDKGASLILKSGNIESNKGTAIKLEYAGNNSFTMEGGSVLGTATTVNAMRGIVTVIGGKIMTSSTSSSCFGVENGYAEAEIIIGEEGGNDEDIYIDSIGGKLNHTVKIYGGTIGKIVRLVSDDSILDGLFENNIDDVLPGGKICEEIGGYYKVVDLTNETDAEAKIGNTLYSSAARAVGDMKDGDTLTILEDLVGSGSGVLNVKAKNAVIDLNGHSFTDDNAKGVISVKIPYGDAEDCETTIKNNGDKQAVITGKIPLAFSSGNSTYTLTVNIEGDILLDSNSGQSIDLGTGSKLAYSEDAAATLGNGGFKSVDKDGNAYIYGGFAYAVEYDADKVVELLNNYTGNESIHSGDSSGALDLDGHTYEYTGNAQIVDVNYDNVEFTIKNGKLTTTSDKLSQGGITVLYNNSSITLDNVHMDVPGDSYGIVTNGSNSNNGVTLRNSTLNVPDGLGIYFPSSGSVTIDNSVINAKYAGVQICAGDLTVTGNNTAITVTGDAEEKTESDGGIVDGAAISIIERTGYQDIGTITIEGGTFTSAGKDKDGEKIPAVKAYGFDNKNKTEQEWADAGKHVDIYGGSYSSVPENMNDICADGYAPIEDVNGNIIVKPGQDVSFEAQIGSTKYKTLEAAFKAAVNGDTITLLKDTELPKAEYKEYNLPDNGIFDLNGKTLTVPYISAIFQGKNAVIENGTFTSSADYPVFIGNGTKDTTITLRNIKVDGGINVYAANAILENVTANANGKTYYAVWGDSGSEVTIKSGVYTAGNTGLAVSVFGGNNPDNPGDPGYIIIEGGDFNGGLDVSKPLNDKSEYISVSGGYFTEDPSEYVVKDKTTLLSDKTGYAYMVGDKPADDPITEKPAITESEVDLKDLQGDLSQEQIANVENTAKSIEADETLIKAADNIHLDVSVKEKAVEKAQTELNSGDKEIIVYKQIFLDIEAENAKTEIIEDVEQIAEITFDITPKMQTVASTAKKASDIELGSVGKNAVIYGEAEELKITYPVKITVELPNAFADEKVYIKHESDNGNYYYNATADGNVLTFVSLHGFSPFTFSLKNGAVAEITVDGNTIGYHTLEDAVNNVKDGQTIVLVKDCDEDIKVNKEISFKLDESKGELKGSIKAGSGYEMDKEKDGDITEYTFEEKASTGHGGGFELDETESSGDYVVRVDEGKHGEVTVSPKRADKGDTIKITVEPEEGYEIDKIKAFDEDEEEIELTENADNKFTFKMPASDVDVEVSFKEKVIKEEDKHVMPFIDIPANIWYRNAVQYVYENGIMSGTSDITFGPDMATTRGMIVTILYRLEGMPKTGTANAFTDVPVGAYYEDAVAWASTNNIVSGYGNGLFGPEDKVTREQMAVIIYNYHKAMGKDVSNIEGMKIYEFTDYESISDWAVTAVRYCLNAGIFNGNADGTLNPKGNVTRAELAVIINNLA